MVRKTIVRRNPLQTPGDITLATEPITEQTEISLLYDYSQIDEQHRSQVMLAARRIKLKAERTKQDLLAIGKELIEVKERLEHGQFGDWLSVEFGMSDRSARRFMAVYETYGGKTDTVSILNDSALYLLSGSNVPDTAREEVEKEAKASGKSPTKRRVQQIIEQHKPPPARAVRILALDETIAVVWRTIKHNLPDTTDPAARRAWLLDATPADFLALLNAGVTLDAALLVAARKRVEAELRGQLYHAQQKAQRATGSQGDRLAQTMAQALEAEFGIPVEIEERPTQQQAIQQLIYVFQNRLDQQDRLDQYSQLTGDFTTPTTYRRLLEQMIHTLESKLT